MDLYPGRYEFDFADLEATEGYNPPHDFLVRELPLDAGGALPGRPKKRELLWYEYPSPFATDDWELELQEETERQLQLEEDSLHRSLEERERQRQQLEADMHRRFPVKKERQRPEDERHRLRQEQDDLYLDEMWANSSTSEGWGPAPSDETPTCSSSPPPASDAPEEHQFHVKEHQVHVKMCEYDDASIPRYRLFKSSANTQELLLGFPLKIPYYIYAGRCNLNVKGYALRYADFFPDFHMWNFNWVCPTTYDGDDQFVGFFTELMRQAEYVNTRDRVLAKAIAIANKGFQKILYFQIELAVADCMMLLEDEEKFEQRYNLYSHIAYEICFKKKKYESVLESIMNGHEGLRYELTELGSDANEDDALEMRELVDHLVRSTPIEQPSTTSSDDYKEWVSKKIDLQFKSCFHLYVDYLVEKINMAQDLDLAPKDMK